MTSELFDSTQPVSARDRLLTAAVQAFAEKGFAGTTTRDIASRAGMSPAAVYVHHSTKEELLYLVSREGHLGSLERIRSAANSTTVPIAQVRAMVESFSRWHAQNSRVARIVQYEFHALTAEHRTEIAGYRRSIEKEMQDALIAGVDDGSLDVDDIKGTALALLSLSIDLVRWFDPAGVITAEQLASLHADLAVRMVSRHDG